MIWDHDPAFYPGDYQGCPQFCYWNDIFGVQETPGDPCASGYWSDVEAHLMSYSYFDDHPQIKKLLVVKDSPALEQRYSLKTSYLGY